ncbi:hypothetical protein RUND412_007660 [Rhizina undulata]
MALRSEEFGFSISFRRYGDDLVDSRNNKDVGNAPKDSADASAEIGASTTEELVKGVSQGLVQQPDSFDSEPDSTREAVENTQNEVSEETAITTVATEEAGAEISGIVIQQPDVFDPDLDSTVGRRSPTPTSDLDSGASTPVPLVVRTQKEIQIDELDRMEDVACNILSSMKSVTALAILKGVLEACKILMGEKHFRSLKTMENLGYWYLEYGWADEGMELLKQAVEGLKSVLGERNEYTLAIMYKLAELKYSRRANKEAWSLFEEVLQGRVEVLGKHHHATVDAIKQLEKTVTKWGYNAST